MALEKGADCGLIRKEKGKGGGGWGGESRQGAKIRRVLEDEKK